MPRQISPVSFSKSIASRDAFGAFIFAAFKLKNIPAAPMFMINPSFFFQSKLAIYCMFFLIIIYNSSKYTNDIDANNASYYPTPSALRTKNLPTSIAAVVVMSCQSPIGFLASTVDPSSMGLFF